MRRLGFSVRQTILGHSCFGRDDAHQRMDLYPVEGQGLRAIIAMYASRSQQGMGGDRTIAGLQRAINLSGRRPVLPRERQAFEYRSHILHLERSPLRHNPVLDIAAHSRTWCRQSTGHMMAVWQRKSVEMRLSVGRPRTPISTPPWRSGLIVRSVLSGLLSAVLFG